jgi:SAM-dependent methyltransferase
MKEETMSRHENWNIAFSLNAQKAAWLMDRLRADVDPRTFAGEDARILDLGCGCGEETFLLAELFPRAEIIGLDISGPNIAHGVREAARRGLNPRVSFLCGDYRDVCFPQEFFELIVADSVLHLIPAGQTDMMTKIAGELRPGGQLAFSIPKPSAFNSLLSAVRTVLRQCRAGWTDRLVLAVARLLHRSEVGDEQLQERVHYMYITPTLWGSAGFHTRLNAQLGLTCEAVRPYPHASLGQFQQAFWVYRKAGPGIGGIRPTPKAA